MTATKESPSTSAIVLRGVRVHNLKGLDLDLPLGELIVLTGLSGSGKSSLAFDTLFAEGQRRYIESFPAYARQFLPKFDRPDADRIDNIPPAIAVGQQGLARSGRTTVAAATGILDHLRLLYAHGAKTQCTQCQAVVRADSPTSLTEELSRLEPGSQVTVAFPIYVDDEADMDELAQSLREEGYVRVEVDGEIHRISQELLPRPPKGQPIRVLLDRLEVGKTSESRMAEALEAAFSRGAGDVHLQTSGQWQSRTDRLWCPVCGIVFPEPSATIFNWANEEARCPQCLGMGDVAEFDFDKSIPDQSKSLRQDALAPLAASSYAAEKQRFLNQAERAGVPLDVSFEKLNPEQQQMLWQGGDGFDGLLGFFQQLDAKRYQPQVRRFLSRFRRYDECPSCGGKRLAAGVLAHKVAGKDFAELLRLTADEALTLLDGFRSDYEAIPAFGRILHRLQYLSTVGLGYVGLDRTVDTLSVGEAQRVALTTALGSGLSRTLFVLDEPTAGLHPSDTEKLIAAIRQLQSRGNTVVVVEHDLEVLRAADQVVELGPEPGDSGGRLVYQGPPAGLEDVEESYTAPFLAPGKRRNRTPRRPKGHLHLEGARRNNLQNLNVRFPMGCLCVVAGVSGAGKSSLVFDTLYPEVARRLGDDSFAAAECDNLWGVERLDEVVSIDAESVGRSSRSNPATYIKVFDEIRKLFADTLEAKTRGLGAGAFSFNVSGGRCDRCEGTGFLTVDMQFLPEVRTVCPDCDGRRYSAAVVEVKYRGLNIDELLRLTVDKAIGFFRGQHKIQEKLTLLRSVGLGYIQLGQPLSTLSGGEAQRLKLASMMATTRRHCLFFFEEPTTGLHAADVQTLLACFDALLEVGHSIIVVEHNIQVLQAADYIIELGPGAGQAGGRIVAEGPPQDIAKLSTECSRLLQSVN